ncbi:hypothetical protein HYX10_03840 [Candidatus Woesearchaeota archaeon]|nr:hypothetical protein [Candidatus Woesearchaeota archaeon]
MRFIILIVISLLFLPLVYAETTFFDQDDAFIIGPVGKQNPNQQQSAPVAPMGGGCTYKWNCTNWSICLPSGKQTRNCTNIGTCSKTYKSPEIMQNCTYVAPEKADGEKEPIEEKETPIQEDREKTEGLQQNYTIFQVIGVTIVIILTGIVYNYFIKRLKKN